jgi:hypothetical protein
MDYVAARHVLEALADGLDPTSGEGLPPGTPLNSPEVVRALHAALAALDDQIKRSSAAGGPANAGKSWSPQDDGALTEAWDAGEGLKRIAARFGRTEDSIAARLVKIGKVPDRQTARKRREPLPG